MQKLKRGDEVVVITGKDKGKRGEITRVFPKENRLIVKGINLCKKHVKPNPSANQTGGIQEREGSIDTSNVAIWNSIAGRADRVGIKIFEAGKKVRVFKSNGERVEQ
jgi:large subunit ribosomal protein L24